VSVKSLAKRRPPDLLKRSAMARALTQDFETVVGQMNRRK
jgi:hypothetical protein